MQPVRIRTLNHLVTSRQVALKTWQYLRETEARVVPLKPQPSDWVLNFLGFAKQTAINYSQHSREVSDLVLKTENLEEEINLLQILNAFASEEMVNGDILTGDLYNAYGHTPYLSEVMKLYGVLENWLKENESSNSDFKSSIQEILSKNIFQTAIEKLKQETDLEPSQIQELQAIYTELLEFKNTLAQKYSC